MNRLTPETLNQLYTHMSTYLSVRREDQITVGKPSFPCHLLICGGTACHASKSIEIKQRLIHEIEKRKLTEKVFVIETGCNGYCAQGPIMLVYPGSIFYQYLSPEDIGEIVAKHICKGLPVKRLLYHDPATNNPVMSRNEVPFFALQQKRVLHNIGWIAAERIEEYIGSGGYLAASKALFSMEPDQIVAEVKTSGIRGRGGAGFPTGLKWEFTRHSQGDVKYVLCNADEGDPGAFMDRSILEADPHSVLEGMIIAAKAIGAYQGYIYCRAEYPLAVKRLTIAISQARHMGLLGHDILGSGYNFDVDIYRGAGAFVCGEETALMTSIEGKRGAPRPRPPFPAVEGLWKKPTVLNNVETLSNIPQIILNGGLWYAELGTMRSKGTKVFALTGDVCNVGLVEVPMGESIGKIIYDIGGGLPKGKKFKAVQLGGPSGGCIPVEHLNTPVDYESITRLGAIVGSGGMIVMDEDKCIVDVARFFMDFCKDESCGKCTPCRVGTEKMLEILTRICNGQGQADDIEKLERYADVLKNTALCGLGQTAPNPVLSTLRYFRNEYEQHIFEKRCPAVVCSAFFKAPCQHGCPIGMDIPGYVALAKADRLEDAYKILLKTNPFPATCGRVCDHKCEAKCRRSTLDDPVHIKHIKRYITDHGPRPVVEPAQITCREKIAVIGAGPSGLTAAKDLTLRGYAVTVFEAMSEPGGMMRWGIPEYRLPRDILSREIDDILALGVDLRCNVHIGKDITIDEIMSDYDALYLAIGAQASSDARLEGQNLSGVMGAVEFLRDLHQGPKPKVGKKVAVIGGGNSAIDAAQCALRLGAKQVTIVYRRTRQDMPALTDEIDAAEKEGVDIQTLVAPMRILGKNNHVKKLICQEMTLGEFDRSGRKKPVPIPGSEYEMDVDQVILAIGQQIDPELDLTEMGFNKTATGFLAVVDGSKTKTHVPMVFAGGDVVTGPDSVVGAILAGHRAAVEIDEAIRARDGKALYVKPSEIEIDIPDTVEEEIHEMPRTPVLEVDTHKRIKDFREVAIGFSKKTAQIESGRCLRCDIGSS